MNIYCIPLMIGIIDNWWGFIDFYNINDDSVNIKIELYGYWEGLNYKNYVLNIEGGNKRRISLSSSQINDGLIDKDENGNRTGKCAVYIECPESVIINPFIGASDENNKPYAPSCLKSTIVEVNK